MKWLLRKPDNKVSSFTLTFSLINQGTRILPKMTDATLVSRNQLLCMYPVSVIPKVGDVGVKCIQQQLKSYLHSCYVTCTCLMKGLVQSASIANVSVRIQEWQMESFNNWFAISNFTSTKKQKNWLHFVKSQYWCKLFELLMDKKF